MFARVNPWLSSTRNLSLVFKRTYKMKKLSIQAQGNPHLQKLVEEKLKTKKEHQGVLNKLVGKRYDEQLSLIAKKKSLLLLEPVNTKNTFRNQ